MKSSKSSKNGISYGRVSTIEQAYHKNGKRREDASPESQRLRCIEHVKYLNHRAQIPYQLISHISDEGFSGKNTRRPGYQKMWSLISNQQIDFVVAIEISRISRSVIDFLELVSHCEKNDVELLIIGLDLNTSTPIGRVLVIILVALAQFEREMTSERVRENALMRLLNDGRINGAGEILGLDRNPEKAGHFLINEEELMHVETLLKLFVKFANKRKVLEEARKIGITGKKGKTLTRTMLDQVIKNANLRYKGLWYANKENAHKDPALLPDNKKFQTVPLPHGPLLENALLDKVEERIEDLKKGKNRVGKKGHVYLLSHIFYFEDGSKYYGGTGKGGEYFYYYSTGSGPNIRCEKLDSLIIDLLKNYLSKNHLFAELVKKTIDKKKTELIKIKDTLLKALEEKEDLNNQINHMKLELAKPEVQESFKLWLKDEIQHSKELIQEKENTIQQWKFVISDIEEKSKMHCFKKVTQAFVAKLDQLPKREKRNFVERIIEKITLKKDYNLEISIRWDPPETIPRAKVLMVNTWRDRGKSDRTKLFPPNFA